VTPSPTRNVTSSSSGRPSGSANETAVDVDVAHGGRVVPAGHAG
jgi:hypothetical protein